LPRPACSSGHGTVCFIHVESDHRLGLTGGGACLGHAWLPALISPGPNIHGGFGKHVLRFLLRFLGYGLSTAFAMPWALTSVLWYSPDPCLTDAAVFRRLCEESVCCVAIRRGDRQIITTCFSSVAGPASPIAIGSCGEDRVIMLGTPLRSMNPGLAFARSA